ncbi:DegT/DnrJ/EryC1/StrS family aminotransferase [Streptomyces sp. NPDC102274]|uniref:DegT/DnrJ/EryC1/StrS family aminotransferase n=1 Tax=Streptomyces sp. NPDC102274 TaxID=3366151 RepID=UPI0037FFE948
MQNSHLRLLLAIEPTLRALRPGRIRPAAIRSVVQRLARTEQTPLITSATRVTVRDGLRREYLTLTSPLRGELRAAVLAPQDAAPGPAILVLGGKTPRLEQLTGDETVDHPDRNVAEQLAHAGFTTLAFAYSIGGALDAARLAGRDEGTVLAHAFALTGRSLLGALVGDALSALDVLRAHPIVDPDRIGLFGHSLGAAVALHTALLADRSMPLCSASHLGSYPSLYAQLLTGFEGAALPGILEYADLPDLYAALAPAPLQLQYGTQDIYLDVADAHAAGQAIRRAYEKEGTKLPEVLKLSMGHGTHVGHASDFFTRELAATTGEPDAPVPAQRILFNVADRRAILDRVDDAIASGVLAQGPLVARFEELTRPWTGTAGVAVASGSAALEIALRVLDVAGRTVLVPVNTFFATAAAAVRAGARVRFVDIELAGLGLDPEALGTALERYPDTAAVVPVHIGGIVSPALDEVLEQCRERGIPVLEDAAHAFGATLGGRPAGSLGRFGAFSFFSTKVAISGEGGLLTGSGSEDLEHVRRWRDHGKSATGSTLHDRPGGNWRLSEMHAAVGTVDLERFAATLAARRELAARYDDLLADSVHLTVHAIPEDSRSNYYKYLAYLDESIDRDLLKKRLRARHGVYLAGEVYDHLLCDHPYFIDAAASVDAYPRGRWFASRHIALPLYPSLTRAEQTRVISALRNELR